MRLDISDNVASATPEVKLLYSVTDNPTFYTSEGTEPMVNQWLLGFTLSARQAMKVEIGLAQSDRSNFTPAFAVHLAAGVPYTYDLEGNSHMLTMSAAAINKLAVKISPVADATPAALAGEVSIGQV